MPPKKLNDLPTKKLALPVKRNSRRVAAADPAPAPAPAISATTSSSDNVNSSEVSMDDGFRFRWMRQRNNQMRQPNNALDTSEDSTNKKSKAKAKANEDDDGEYEGDNSEGEDLEDLNYDINAAKPSRDFSANGRSQGRQLIPWHRPRMMEKLIMCVQYECQRHNINLPWQDIVHRLNPGSSGEAALQFLAKERDKLIAEGHMVPPMIGHHVKNKMVDSTIRGYVRDDASDIPTVSKVLRWGQYYQHPKINREIPGVVYGSGQYKKNKTWTLGSTKAIPLLVKPTDGTRRDRRPAEVIQAETECRRPQRKRVQRSQNLEDSAESDAEFGLEKAAKKAKHNAPDYEEKKSAKKAKHKVKVEPKSPKKKAVEMKFEAPQVPPNNSQEFSVPTRPISAVSISDVKEWQKMEEERKKSAQTQASGAGETLVGASVDSSVGSTARSTAGSGFGSADTTVNDDFQGLVGGLMGPVTPARQVQAANYPANNYLTPNTTWDPSGFINYPRFSYPAQGVDIQGPWSNYLNSDTGFDFSSTGLGSLDFDMNSMPTPSFGSNFGSGSYVGGSFGGGSQNNRSFGIAVNPTTPSPASYAPFGSYSGIVRQLFTSGGADRENAVQPAPAGDDDFDDGEDFAFE